MYHNFIMEDVKEPILGADLLEKCNLTLKMRKQIVQDEETGICVKDYKSFLITYAIKQKICLPMCKKDYQILII